MTLQTLHVLQAQIQVIFGNSLMYEVLTVSNSVWCFRTWNSGSYPFINQEGALTSYRKAKCQLLCWALSPWLVTVICVMGKDSPCGNRSGTSSSPKEAAPFWSLCYCRALWFRWFSIAESNHCMTSTLFSRHHRFGLTFLRISVP